MQCLSAVSLTCPKNQVPRYDIYVYRETKIVALSLYISSDQTNRFANPAFK